MKRTDEVKKTLLVPSDGDRSKIMGNVNMENAANMQPCNCTACGSCRCTPCK